MNTLKIKSNNKDQIIKEINSFRLQNKNNWYQFNVLYNGTEYKGKCYNTWIQLLYHGKYNSSSCMDISVKQFKEHLFHTLN